MEVEEQSERTRIAELTTEIVTAYVSYHRIHGTGGPGGDQRGRDRIGVARYGS